MLHHFRRKRVLAAKRLQFRFQSIFFGLFCLKGRLKGLHGPFIRFQDRGEVVLYASFKIFRSFIDRPAIEDRVGVNRFFGCR